MAYAFENIAFNKILIKLRLLSHYNKASLIWVKENKKFTFPLKNDVSCLIGNSKLVTSKIFWTKGNICIIGEAQKCGLAGLSFLYQTTFYYIMIIWKLMGYYDPSLAHSTKMLSDTGRTTLRVCSFWAPPVVLLRIRPVKIYFFVYILYSA